MTSQPTTGIAPFLKWAGGKRWFTARYAQSIPHFEGRYIEPFLGGGAVFFHLGPKSAVLSDTNEWLISTYEALRDGWRQIEEILKRHEAAHCHDYYYHIRSKKCRGRYERAAQFLYLNRTCWNGLFRVNLKGQFNVPIGTKTNVLLNDDFEKIASLLKRAVLKVQDFEVTIDNAKKGDFIFADPPYTVKHNYNGFIKYNENIFSWGDQERLQQALCRARTRGAKIMLTNANHESIRNLYSNDFRISELERVSLLSGKKEFRSKVSELLITAGV